MWYVGIICVCTIVLATVISVASGVNIFLNLPSFFILRYNSYKLRVLKRNLVKRVK